MPPPGMFLDRRHKLFLVLAAIFLVCFVVGDIIGGKLVEVRLLGFSWGTTVGMIPFPVTFLLTDLLNEFYGKRAARFVTLVGFGAAVLAFVLITIAGTVDPHPMSKGWGGVSKLAFDEVFMGSRRILVASLCAYLVSQFIDIGIFQVLKRTTQNRMLWLRATGSTAASQLIDTAIVSTLGWGEQMPLAELVKMIFVNYGLKVVIAVALTPLIYLGHALVQRGLGIQPILVGDAPDDRVVSSPSQG